MQRPLPFLLLLVAGACTKPAPTPTAATVADSAAMAQAHAGMPAMDPEVHLVASIMLAMKKHPEFRDSMLKAYAVTPAQFDSMKAHIAADSAKNAAFQRLIAQ